MSISEKIRLVMVRRKLSGRALAQDVGFTAQNLYTMLKKDNWNEEQLRKVAESLDCDVEITLRMRDTGEKY